MKPVVDRLKQEYEGKVTFKLYNVESDQEGQALAQQYGAQYVPTFVFVKSDGSVLETKVGETSEDDLKAALDALQ